MEYVGGQGRGGAKKRAADLVEVRRLGVYGESTLYFSVGGDEWDVDLCYLRGIHGRYN